MKIGDLVKVDDQLSFAAHFIGMVGIVVQTKGHVCSVLFPSLDNEYKSFMKRDLVIVSDADERI
jgi:hypothetical protein